MAASCGHNLNLTGGYPRAHCLQSAVHSHYVRCSGRGHRARAHNLAINPAGAITGFYFDAGDTIHGFLRSPDGTIGTIDVPGAGTGPGQGTNPFSITSGGAIAGRYADANIVSWFPALRTA
jgi:hypothetical protein